MDAYYHPDNTLSCLCNLTHCAVHFRQYQTQQIQTVDLHRHEVLHTPARMWPYTYSSVPVYTVFHFILSTQKQNLFVLCVYSDEYTKCAACVEQLHGTRSPPICWGGDERGPPRYFDWMLPSNHDKLITDKVPIHVLESGYIMGTTEVIWLDVA